MSIYECLRVFNVCEEDSEVRANERRTTSQTAQGNREKTTRPSRAERQEKRLAGKTPSRKNALAGKTPQPYLAVDDQADRVKVLALHQR